MLKFNRFLLVLIAGFAVSGPSAILAQTTGGQSNNGSTGSTGSTQGSEETGTTGGTTGGGEGGYGDDEGSYDGDYSEPEGGPNQGEPPRRKSTPATSETLIESLKVATAYCSPMEPSEYVIDCLSERMSELSKQLDGQKEFADVQAILESTAKQLNQIARQNRSTTLPPAKFTTNGQSPVQTTRRLVPVDTAKMDVAVTQALAVIEETETLLLRSAEGSIDRSIQFQQIAAAVGSNKVLLRSI